EFVTASAGINRGRRRGIDGQGVDPERIGQAAVDGRPASTAVAASEDTATFGPGVDRACRRIDGQRGNTCVVQAVVDGRPALPSVRALEDAPAIRAGVEGGWRRLSKDQARDKRVGQTGVPGCPARAAVDALEDSAAARPDIDRRRVRGVKCKDPYA